VGSRAGGRAEIFQEIGLGKHRVRVRYRVRVEARVRVQARVMVRARAMIRARGRGRGGGRVLVRVRDRARFGRDRPELGHLSSGTQKMHRSPK
jgi:hypothetical protein